MHRIGRTARAGAEGIALSFCAAEEVAILRSIERLTGVPLTIVSRGARGRIPSLADGNNGQGAAKRQRRRRGKNPRIRRKRRRKGRSNGNRRDGDSWYIDAVGPAREWTAQCQCEFAKSARGGEARGQAGNACLGGGLARRRRLVSDSPAVWPIKLKGRID